MRDKWEQRDRVSRPRRATAYVALKVPDRKQPRELSVARLMLKAAFGALPMYVGWTVRYVNGDKGDCALANLRFGPAKQPPPPVPEWVWALSWRPRWGARSPSSSPATTARNSPTTSRSCGGGASMTSRSPSEELASRGIHVDLRTLQRAVTTLRQGDLVPQVGPQRDPRVIPPHRPQGRPSPGPRDRAHFPSVQPVPG